ncbi:phosphohydrolase [Deinococcus malanensis]|uniref:phosphohydrolase n=1 Tax=Deinococcus malanensis TaxID=1706855 RepID=UPI00363475F3
MAEHLDPEQAYVYGLIHDIGRRAGVSDLRHIIDGYHYLMDQVFPQAARISMTHSFPLQDVDAGAGVWDCSPEEKALVASYLASVTYDEYDRLLQLCDALALSAGFCLLEKRFVDVVRRRGFNALALQKWEAWLELERSFSQAVGGSIYAHLPGVVHTTFGVSLRM